jgi:hypothetical protein
MRNLEEPWNLTLQECLKAYAVDPSRGESIKTIIDYYLQIGEWSLAYLYSKFAIETFHGKPYPKRLLLMRLYTLEVCRGTCSGFCFYCGRKEEARIISTNTKMSKENPKSFSVDDLKKIKPHSLN